MIGFNAQQAKNILDNFEKDEVNNILIDIKLKAEQGKDVLHICKSVENKTKKLLIEKGFLFIEHSSMSIQKEGLYYSVYWN